MIRKTVGRWRLYAFAGPEDPASVQAPIAELCRFLEKGINSPIRRHTPAGHDIDAVLDVRAVFQQSHSELSLTDLPSLLLPRKGRLGLADYEKAFCRVANIQDDIFAMRGIDRQGCLVLVRPDQYIAHVLPLDAHDEVAAFFDRILIRQLTPRE